MYARKTCPPSPSRAKRLIGYRVDRDVEPSYNSELVALQDQTLQTLFLYILVAQPELSKKAKRQLPRVHSRIVPTFCNLEPPRAGVC